MGQHTTFIAGAALLLGLAVVAVVPIVIPLAILGALGAIAHQTTPRGQPRPRAATILAGLVGYPAACAILILLVSGGGEDINFAFGVLILTLPALALGMAIPRVWTALLPLAVAAVAFSVGYLSDPACSHCGEDTWSYAIGSTLLFLVAPSVLMVELGIMVRHLITRARRSRRGSAR